MELKTGKQKKDNKFGLIGKNISYSFSQKYFSNKFKKEGLDNYIYLNFDINSISQITNILKKNSSIKGLNVTIPYKESVIPFLDKLSNKAKNIGAVNTIRYTKKGELKGYNTDEYGFRNSLLPHLKAHHKKALVLGTGGASKAIAYALEKLHIEYSYVSRNKNTNYTYNTLTTEIIKEHHIIINCTPLGTFPEIEEYPNIPYDGISNEHLLYDLIYNPKETTFLKKGKKQGAQIINGIKMLELQAEKAWRIWNK
jgi:shikimate dehydrogenase|tara:strand:- start:1004 stop:1765 length:762 start_codon:yes stop_codon:yes gene_type:complete